MSDISKIILFCMFIAVILSMCGGGSSNKTDGIFESATRKLDAGEPLSKKEKERLNTILFDKRWDGDK
jgi:hypothetical protein